MVITYASTYRLRTRGEKSQMSDGIKLIRARSIRINSNALVPFKYGKNRSSLTSERILWKTNSAVKEMGVSVAYTSLHLFLYIQYRIYDKLTISSTEVGKRKLSVRWWRLDCRAVPVQSREPLVERHPI